MTKAAFLDRDGTINVDHGYVFEISKFEFTDRAAEGLKKLQQGGYALAVITNQSGIAAGYYGVAEMEKLHSYMKRQLLKSGVKIDAIAYCPHARAGDCECRKPKIGMIKQVVEKIGEIDFKKSWTIGDKEADVLMGQAAGTKTALVRSQYWQENDLAAKPDVIADSLWDAAEKIVTRN